MLCSLLPQKWREDLLMEKRRRQVGPLPAFAGKIHNNLAVSGRGDEAVMFFSSKTCHRLKLSV